MSESLTNYKIGHEKKLLFLNRERVVGVQSVITNQNFAATPLSYAGIGVDTVKYIPRGEQSNTVNINSYLINKDYFLAAVTGNNLYNLYVLSSSTDFTNNYILNSGYFNSYKTSYNVGSVASVEAGFVCVGNAGPMATGQLEYVVTNDFNSISTTNYDITGILVPDIGSITLDIDTFQTNRLLSYSIDVNTKKIPIYVLGRRTPKRVDRINTEINCNFTFEVGTYIAQQLRNFPQSGIVKNLNVTVKDHLNNDTICNYSFQNLNLVSEEYSLNVGDNLTVNQSYQTILY